MKNWAWTSSTPGIGGRFMNETTRTEAEYFGLKVEVTCRMEHCALVRFREREFVVDAEDLKFPHTFRLTTIVGAPESIEQPCLKYFPNTIVSAAKYPCIRLCSEWAARTQHGGAP